MIAVSYCVVIDSMEEDLSLIVAKSLAFFMRSVQDIFDHSRIDEILSVLYDFIKTDEIFDKVKIEIVFNSRIFVLS